MAMKESEGDIELNLRDEGSHLNHSHFTASSSLKTCRARLMERRKVLMYIGAFLIGCALGLLVKSCTKGVPRAAPSNNPSTVLSAEARPSDCAVAPVKREIATEQGMSYRCDGSAIPGRGACGTMAAVAASNPVAAQAGLDILRAGGNVYDAAIAVQSVLTVVEPWMSGVGGGAFAMLYNSTTRKVHFLDAREEAPAKFSINSFCEDKECAEDEKCECEEFFGEREGGVSIGIPGVPYALHLFDQRRNLHRNVSLAKAIDLAATGFVTSELFYNQVAKNTPSLRLFNGSKFYFLSPPTFAEPRVLPGELMINRPLAATFRRVLEAGWTDFYTGDIAKDIVAAATSSFAPTLQRASPMTLDDLKGYQAVWREPVSFTYRGKYKLYSSNYPSSGGTTLGLILQMLENISPEDYASPHFENLAFIQSFLAAQDIAFSERNLYMGDADFTDIPSRLQNKTYARALFSEFAKLATRSKVKKPSGRTDNGTSHFSIVDNEGNILSMTTTVEGEFGSYVTVPERGFILNNQLTDFEEEAYETEDGERQLHSNAPEGGKKLRRTAIEGGNATLGGKRPMSSMSPTIVFDNLGRPVIAIGASGGSRIIGAVANALIGLLDFDLYPTNAIRIPRVISRGEHTQLDNGALRKASWGSLEITGSPSGKHCRGILKNITEYKRYEYATLAAALCSRGFHVSSDPLHALVHAIRLDYAADGSPRIYASGDQRAMGTGLAY